MLPHLAESIPCAPVYLCGSICSGHINNGVDGLKLYDIVAIRLHRTLLLPTSNEAKEGFPPGNF